MQWTQVNFERKCNGSGPPLFLSIPYCNMTFILIISLGLFLQLILMSYMNYIPIVYSFLVTGKKCGEKNSNETQDRLLPLLCLSVKTILVQRKHLSSLQIDTFKESRINAKRWTCLYQHNGISQTNAGASRSYPHVKFGFTYLS